MPGQHLPTTLKRTLGVGNLALYGISYMMPVVGFTLFGWVELASGGGAALAYLIASLGIGITGLSYAVLATAFPQAGSVYTFATRSLGSVAGFVGGWSILLDYLLIPALIVLYGGIMMNQAFPAIPVEVWIAAFLLFATIANVLGLELSKKVDIVLAGGQFAVIALFLVTGTLLLLTGGGGFTLQPVLLGTTGPGGMLSAASLVVLSFLGFDAISTLAEEVRPQARGRAIATGIATCIGVMTVTYVAVTWVLEDLGRGFQAGVDPGAMPFMIVGSFMPWLAWPLTVTCGLALGIGASIPPQAAVARVLYAMAREGGMPRPLALLHRRYSSPYIAVLLSGVVMAVCAYAAISNVELLASLVSFGALAAFLFVNASVIAWFGLRRRSRRWLLHWLLPAAGFGVCAFLLVGMRPLSLEIGFTWLAVGFAVAIALHFRRRLAGAGQP